MKKTLCILVIFLLANTWLEAQSIQEWTGSKKSILFEKVYLHIDRHFYSPGDNIWFKTYLLMGLNHKLISGYKNIYVQLVSDNGKVMTERILLTQNGVAHGDILVTDSIPDGRYTLRAFTRYLENFGSESYFNHTIFISKAKNSLDINLEPPGTNPPIDAAFMPESGHLVLNALNHVAFKVVGRDGKGIDVSGRIVDGKDSTITFFKSSWLGMGRFMMMPHEGNTYFARIDSYPDLKYPLGNPLEKGLTLNYSKEGDEAVFTVSRNFKISAPFNGFLVASHKGIVRFYKKIELTGIHSSVKVSGEMFPEGISKITLLGEDLGQVAERLIFIYNQSPDIIQVSPGKPDYSTREKVTLDIDLKLADNDSLQETFSIAVVNRNYLFSGDVLQSLKSYMLLDSELKGNIESPSAYFTDEKNISAAEKLDLLMMVNGWRKYNWDDFIANRPAEALGWSDAGISVEGYVKALFRNRPVVNGEVVLGPFSRNFMYETTHTDSAGRFRFDRLYIRDMEKIFIRATNEKGRAGTEIIPDPVRPFQTRMIEMDDSTRTNGLSATMDFFRENFYRQLKIREFYPDTGSILLDRIDIFGRKRTRDDGHFRLYNQADRSFNITEEDFTFNTVLDFLSSKPSGVIVSGDHISIRGGGMPLFLLDGIPVNDMASAEDILYRMPLNDIERIEILYNPANMALFGSQGADGVIAVYSKTGDPYADPERYVRGRASLRIKGFRKPAEFYSPRYMPENRHDPRPDYRPTLLWAPDLVFTNNKATLDFFTSDELAEYLVIVEGVTKNGKMVSGKSEFRVASFFDK